MAQPEGPIELRFPAGGLNRHYAYQHQPPYTTPDALNVRPFDVIAGRERGGTRPGTVKVFTTNMSTSAPVQMAYAADVVASTGIVTQVLLAVCGGNLWRSTSTTLTQVSGTLNSTALAIRAAQVDNIVFIADTRPGGAIIGSNGVISGAGKNELTASGVNWETLGVDPALDVVAVADVSTAEDNIYPITSVSGATLTINGTFTSAPTTNTAFEIGRRIKVFDVDANTLAGLGTTSAPVLHGIPPLNCPLVCVHKDRLWLAGPGINWYASRSNSDATAEIGVYCWDYGADDTDVERAVAGVCDGPIKALIPSDKDTLLMGCEKSLWALRGDPTYGGGRERISGTIGVISQEAWCSLPDSSVVFLSRGGLYVVPGGGQSPPESFSKKPLPRELLDVNPAANHVALAYDVRDNGVHVFISPTSGAAGTHYWIDMEGKGFWPVSHAAAHNPSCAALFAAATSSQQHVMLGCRDGYIRRYDPTATTDDGTAITSYCKIGPIPLGPPGYEGQVAELQVDLAVGSANATVDVRVGKTAEAAATTTSAPATQSLIAGPNPRTYPRLRGVASTVQVGATSAQWSLEGIRIRRRPGGRAR